MKRFFALFLSIVLLFSALCLNSFAIHMGDVNKDGKVNSTDAIIILNYTTGKLSSFRNYDLADLNADGNINSADALSVLRISVGILQPTEYDPYYSLYASKKYLIIGDSYSNTDPNRGTVFSPWVNEFSKQVKASTVTNMSYSGSSWGFSFYTKSKNVPYGFDIVNDAISNKSINPDVLIFFLGANDYAIWYDENIDDVMAFSQSELNEKKYGLNSLSSMRVCIESAKKAYPDATIFLCTPIPIKTATFPPITPESTLIKREKQIQLAKKLGIEIIDTYSCKINSGNVEKYVNVKNNHPNEAGAQVLAEFISEAVKNYYINK